MTATPASETTERFKLASDDLSHPQMRERLYSKKAVRLLSIKARAKDYLKLAENLVEQAIDLSVKPGLKRIALMVNRVRTARAAYDLLGQRGLVRHLLIGRMRPVDRSALPPDLSDMLSGKSRTHDGPPVFVVATQCLEVGA